MTDAGRHELKPPFEVYDRDGIEIADASGRICIAEGPAEALAILAALSAAARPAQEPLAWQPTDQELAAWARNWHWNDCAEDRPVDPSIYFRDMRMLKAYIARANLSLSGETSK